ncbi:MAG: hypothetical protein GY938_32645 [Ketobacter sp.]|nr:hypothetical protein [Ketobacter sp.]
MTDFTDEQLAAIRRALLSPSADELSIKTAGAVLAELTSKSHHFREGEVYAYYPNENKPGCTGYTWFRPTMGSRPNARPLSLSEMPKEVEDLRAALMQIKVILAYPRTVEIANRALATFDKVIKP